MRNTMKVLFSIWVAVTGSWFEMLLMQLPTWLATVVVVGAIAPVWLPFFFMSWFSLGFANFNPAAMPFLLIFIFALAVLIDFGLVFGLKKTLQGILVRKKARSW